MELNTKKDWDYMDMACNSSGVIQALARDIKELSGDTYLRNRHPIVKAYLLKLCDLAGIEITMDEYTIHYAKVSDYFRTNEVK